MRYKELMKDYHSKGMVSEKKMWGAIGELDEAMECLKEKDPEKYDEAIRDLHEVFCGPHYNECFAREDVAGMHHKNAKGEVIKGEHWNIEQVTSAIKGMSIPGNTNIWDVYVALNANWHDKNVKFLEWFNADADKKIIEDAIIFYFMDADAPDGKVWLYMDAMDD
ncbi:hypothetical protein [uncultured Parabacteroides sp.]|uniref:DUF7841 family protein n=1 Tax=uncultured Parabacteroides sp. TaxID=512312 RepID=UPI0025DF2100|nr:hypothetical protein [uncultured Parabacteroides sp.]